MELEHISAQARDAGFLIIQEEEKGEEEEDQESLSMFIFRCTLWLLCLLLDEASRPVLLVPYVYLSVFFLFPLETNSVVLLE